MFQSGQEALPLKVAGEAKEDGKGVEELRLHQARGTQFESGPSSFLRRPWTCSWARPCALICTGPSQPGPVKSTFRRGMHRSCRRHVRHDRPPSHRSSEDLRPFTNRPSGRCTASQPPFTTKFWGQTKSPSRIRQSEHLLHIPPLMHHIHKAQLNI